MKKLNFKDLMVFIILSATVAIAYQLPYLRYTFYDQMVETLKLTNVQMGVLASAVSLTSTICYPIGGYLADRFSTRNLICITLFAFVLITIWFAFTTNYILLIIIQVLYGIFGIATLWSAYLSGIRNLADAESQSKIFGSSEATRGIIQTLMGFAFLGIMVSASSAQSGFRLLLLVGAGVAAVFFVLALIYLPKEEVKAVENNDEKYTIKEVLANPGVWITILVICCAYISWTVGNGYLTTYTVQVLNISPSLATTLGIVRSYIIVFLAGFIGGFILDKFTYKGKAFLIMFTSIIVIVLGVMLTSKVIPICIGLTLVIAFVANVMKSTYWSVMEQAGIPVKMTPLATGIISFIAFIPDFIVGPLCGSWLDTAKAAGNVADGFNKIFMLLIVSSAIGILSSVLLMRRTKKINQLKEEVTLN
ncbi:MAG: MFS transporter [Eubacterium sp.]